MCCHFQVWQDVLREPPHTGNARVHVWLQEGRTQDDREGQPSRSWGQAAQDMTVLARPILSPFTQTGLKRWMHSARAWAFINKQPVMQSYEKLAFRILGNYQRFCRWFCCIATAECGAVYRGNGLLSGALCRLLDHFTVFTVVVQSDLDSTSYTKLFVLFFRYFGRLWSNFFIIIKYCHFLHYSLSYALSSVGQCELLGASFTDVHNFCRCKKGLRTFVRCQPADLELETLSKSTWLSACQHIVLVLCIKLFKSAAAIPDLTELSLHSVQRFKTLTPTCLSVSMQ